VGSEHSRKEPSRQLNLLAIRNLYSWEEVILHRTNLSTGRGWFLNLNFRRGSDDFIKQKVYL
jgi:hypothetical protein